MKERWVAKINGDAWAYKVVSSPVELQFWKDSVAEVIRFQDQQHKTSRVVTFERSTPVRSPLRNPHV